MRRPLRRRHQGHPLRRNGRRRFDHGHPDARRRAPDRPSPSSASGGEAREALDALAALSPTASARTNDARHVARRSAPATSGSLRPDRTPNVRMGDDLIRRAFGQDVAAVDDVGAVDQAEGFAYIVIGDEDPDASTLQVADEILNVADGDRIDASERFVKQHEGRLAGKRAGDLASAPLAARQRNRRRLAHARDIELVEQRIRASPRAPPCRAR